MTPDKNISLRLHNQLLTRSLKTPQQVVAHMVAMQAQDIQAAKWAIALRTTNCTLTEIDKAIARGQIIRTWPMRGTLHFVAANDIKWLLELLAPRIISASRTRHRQLELDEIVLQKSRDMVTKALQEHSQLSRPDLYQILETNGIATTGQRGIHILAYLAQTALICFAPHQDKQPAFALLSQWAPQAESQPKDQSLAMLASRYFTSHGPATIHDYMWWSGLTAIDAKVGISLSNGLQSESIDDKTYYWAEGRYSKSQPHSLLLPGFDEYLLGYKDRSLVLSPEHSQKVAPGANGVFMPMIVQNGHIIGTWKRQLKAPELEINFNWFDQKDATTSLKQAITRYSHYMYQAVEKI